MRAVINHVNVPARLLHRLQHLGVNGIERVHVEQTALDPALIGGHRNVISRTIEPRNRLQSPRKRTPLVGSFNEAITIEIDGAVAVEDDEFQDKPPADVVMPPTVQATQRDSFRGVPMPEERPDWP